jgi:hypothetical protein
MLRSMVAAGVEQIGALASMFGLSLGVSCILYASSFKQLWAQLA